ANDDYARQRGALVDLTPKLAAANAALQQAQATEQAAITRAILGLAGAAVDVDDATPHVRSGGSHPHRRSRASTIGRRVAAVPSLGGRLTTAAKSAHAAWLHAQADVSDLTARVTAENQALADASAARTTAEAAIEAELGPDAVRALPDGITATL